MALPILLQILVAIVATLLLSKLLWPTRSKKTQEPPQPSWALPIIGHFLLLPPTASTFRTLAAMADKCGPAFLLRLGSRRVLVVSTWELAKECFTTNDKAFATRPQTQVSEHLGYNYAIFSLAPYGPYWREIRRLVTSEFLSERRTEQLKHVRVQELEVRLKELFESWVENGRKPVVMEVKRWSIDLTFNVLMQMMAGRRYFGKSVSKEEEEFGRKVQRLSKQFLGLASDDFSDAFPFLRWLDLKGQKRAMQRVSAELDSLMQGWVEEHNRRKKDSGDRKVFIDVLVEKARETQYTAGHDRDTIIKATVLNLLIGGVDAIASMVIWSFVLMLNHREVLAKAQAELDVHVGKERVVDESDIDKLDYLRAIIKETFRLYPPVPLLLPHEAMEECHVGGYRIRRGTQLFVNTWKINRDPHVWSCPEKFQPERFLEKHKNVDVRGQHFELIPFGSGRRSCPGIPLGVNAPHLIIARLLQSFDWGTPNGVTIDMEEMPGYFVSKREDYQVLITPRLPSSLY